MAQETLKPGDIVVPLAFTLRTGSYTSTITVDGLKAQDGVGLAIALSSALAERVRQLEVEGYSVENDREQADSLMAAAGAYLRAAALLQQGCKAEHAREVALSRYPGDWRHDLFKVTTLERCLEKAAALTLAALQVVPKTPEAETLDRGHKEPEHQQHSHRFDLSDAEKDAVLADEANPITRADTAVARRIGPLRVIDRQTGQEVRGVTECDTVAGWLTCYRYDEAGQPILAPGGEEWEQETRQGSFRIERMAVQS
jgi:hypothetical protein